MLTKEMVVNLPSLPGVYFFLSRSGEILYIGKAKSLKKRVRSYLYNSKQNRWGKIKRLVQHATQVEYQVCASELEALLLESHPSPCTPQPHIPLTLHLAHLSLIPLTLHLAHLSLTPHSPFTLHTADSHPTHPSPCTPQPHTPLTLHLAHFSLTPPLYKAV